MERYFLKLLVVLAFVVSGWSGISWARSLQNFPQLLTYRGLISLSPEKRRAYVTEVRQILGDFQSSMDKKLSQREVAEIEEIRRQLNLFELLIPTAQAEGNTSQKLIPRIVEVEGGRGLKRWVCDDSASLEFNLDVGTCVLKGSKDQGYCPKDYRYGTVKSSKGSNRLPNGYCIPSDSWNALMTDRQEALKNRTALRLSEFYGTYNRQSSKGKTMLTPSMVLGGASEEDRSLATGGLSEERAVELINQAGAKGLPEQSNPSVVQDAEITLPTTPPPIHPASASEDKKEPEDKFQGTCQPDLKCSDITKAKKNELRNQLGGDVCIAGGNFSKYRNGKPSPGACITMRTWPSDSPNPKLSCKGVNEAMCNPFLYCLNDEKEPFCIKPTQSFTADCEAKVKNLKCDPARVEVLGFQEEWTGLRQKFSTLVGEKCLLSDSTKEHAPEDLAFQKFFCTECQAISKRLHGANLKIVGNGCGVAKVDSQTPGSPAKTTTGSDPTATQ